MEEGGEEERLGKVQIAMHHTFVLSIPVPLATCT
jgi:hypothetical protein